MKQEEFDLIITAQKINRQYWFDLLRYRELFYFMVWRDILVRYKQTVVGIAWSVLRPLLTMVAFVFVFNKVAKLESSNAPYPVMVFVALLPWQLFSNALSEASNSLISNSNLISKVYFPRLIIPISSVVVCLVDFFISLGILIVLMLSYGYFPDLKVLFLPFFLLMALILAVGLGVWLAALNVKYRDFRYIVPFIVQFGLYISPVGFSSDIIPDKWRLLYSLNPMVGVIEGFRWCFIKNYSHIYMPSIISSIGLSIFLLGMGIKYFRLTERSFADRI